MKKYPADITVKSLKGGGEINLEFLTAKSYFLLADNIFHKHFIIVIPLSTKNVTFIMINKMLLFIFV